MKLSHVLYKVSDVKKSVKQFEDYGFSVSLGANETKAYNAFVWFENGPFLELFQMPSGDSLKIKFTMSMIKLLGMKGIYNRFSHYVHSPLGFCDLAIETTELDLKKENESLSHLGYKYNKKPSKRVNSHGETLKWNLTIPYDQTMPFLMSAYNIDQRPKSIKHPNGAKQICKLTFGTEEKNISNLKKLVDDPRLHLCAGNGIIDLEIEGWDNPILHPTLNSDKSII